MGFTCSLPRIKIECLYTDLEDFSIALSNAGKAEVKSDLGG
jgi:hypothetical protein